MFSSVGSCISCCHLGDELLPGVVTGYGRNCHVEAVLGLEGLAWSVGGVGEAWAGESDGSVIGDAEDWSSGGSAASSCWSWASMAGVGLSVSSGSPVGGKGSGPGDGA